MSKNSLTSAGAFLCGLLVMAGVGHDAGNVARAEDQALKKEYINPTQMGFTNVVGITAGGVKTLYISGQVGYGEGGIPDSIEDQADLAFKNLIAELKAAGAGAGDVIKVNTYIKDLDAARVQAVGAAKAKYFTEKDQPASTWVGVTGLVYPQLLVEIEAIAVIEAD